MSGEVRFSVVVCTWNRADLLVDTVDSVDAARRNFDSPHAIELIVVDNASTDDTAVRMKPYSHDGTVRLLHEGKPGLSHARNAGVRAVNGDWIVFLDDDVLLPLTYFTTLAHEVERNPGVGFFAGGVWPVFEKQAPTWIAGVLGQYDWCYSALNLGKDSAPLKESQYPFGANMIVRTDWARKISFDVDRGFRHGSLVPGEETTFFHHLRELGARGRWIGGISVDHRMPISRSTVRFALSRAWGQGRADEMAGAERGSGALWVVKELLLIIGKFPRSLVGGRTSLVPWSMATLRALAHLTARVMRRIGN